MRRMHVFEFTDLAWYPAFFRRMQTEYLQFVTTLGAGHKNLLPFIQRGMQMTGTSAVIDLCSGGGGPWMGLMEQFHQAGIPVDVILTDKFPNPEIMQKWPEAKREWITYFPEPVDATQVPESLKGMRTLFEGFHHFKPEQAQAILKDAADHSAAIGVFEASLKPLFKWPLLILSPITTLLGYLFATPFIKPRSFWRFLWTYIIPLVPLATCWDGVISMLRVYSPEALHKLVQPLQLPDYYWEVGTASTDTPVFTFTYLLGYPLDESLT